MSQLNARKSEGLLVAFDILVKLFERYDRNCVCSRHNFHRIDERKRAVNKSNPAACLVIDTT